MNQLVTGDVKYIEKRQIVRMLPDPIPIFTEETARAFGSAKFECAFDTEHEVVQSTAANLNSPLYKCECSYIFVHSK